jgi:superfamily II DNA or RNA helicase
VEEFVLIISNKITIKSTPELLKYAKTHLVLINPEYEKKLRLNLWLGKTPKNIEYYETNGDNIILPFGCIDWLKANGYTSSDYTLDCNLETPYRWDFELNLYDYQKKAVDAMLKKKHGIFIAPAGSGKTQIFIDLIFKMGKKTLILTHTIDLLKQIKDRVKALTGIECGTITGGKIDIRDITVATVQTMCKMDLQQYQYQWGVVVADEIHRAVGSPTQLGMFYKILSNLKCIHKFGCTATFHRADGNQEAIKFLFGDVVTEVEKDEVKTLKASVIRIDTSLELKECFESDGTMNYTKAISELVRNYQRNKLIAYQIKKSTCKACIVLSDRLEQLREIKEMVGYGVMIDGTMTSKKGKLQREKAIEDMRNGLEYVMYASYKLAKEGLDIPILDGLFLASPQKDLAVIVQSVGRIERIFEGKKECLVYDFVDTDFESMYRKRKVIYKKNKNFVIDN